MISREEQDTTEGEGQVSRLVKDNFDLYKHLDFDYLPLIIDIGAAENESKIGYERLVEDNKSRLIGFEPNKEEFDKLEDTVNKKYLNLAAGDGNVAQLRICASPHMSSCLSPNHLWLSNFPMFKKWSKVISVKELITTKLDEVASLKGARFLKIDCQGFEHKILKNSIRLLGELCVLQIELSPTPLYIGESSLFEIGAWLQTKGWILHRFSNLDHRQLKPLGKDAYPYRSGSQLLQVDAVFIPNPDRWNLMSDDQLKSLALFSHEIYKSRDLAMAVLRFLDERRQTETALDYEQWLLSAN